MVRPPRTTREANEPGSLTAFYAAARPGRRWARQAARRLIRYVRPEKANNPGGRISGYRHSGDRHSLRACVLDRERNNGGSPLRGGDRGNLANLEMPDRGALVVCTGRAREGHDGECD